MTGVPPQTSVTEAHYAKVMHPLINYFTCRRENLPTRIKTGPAGDKVGRALR